MTEEISSAVEPLAEDTPVVKVTAATAVLVVAFPYDDEIASCVRRDGRTLLAAPRERIHSKFWAYRLAQANRWQARERQACQQGNSSSPHEIDATGGGGRSASISDRTFHYAHEGDSTRSVLLTRTLPCSISPTVRDTS
jgi:hypothetical protein